MTNPISLELFVVNDWKETLARADDAYFAYLEEDMHRLYDDLIDYLEEIHSQNNPKHPTKLIDALRSIDLSVIQSNKYGAFIQKSEYAPRIFITNATLIINRVVAHTVFSPSKMDDEDRCLHITQAISNIESNNISADDIVQLLTEMKVYDQLLLSKLYKVHPDANHRVSYELLADFFTAYIFLHEIYHLIFEHLDWLNPPPEQRNAELMEFAADHFATHHMQNFCHKIFSNLASFIAPYDYFDFLAALFAYMFSIVSAVKRCRGDIQGSPHPVDTDRLGYVLFNYTGSSYGYGRLSHLKHLELNVDNLVFTPRAARIFRVISNSRPKEYPISESI